MSASRWWREGASVCARELVNDEEGGEMDKRRASDKALSLENEVVA